MAEFRPTYITFDCYGTLIDFQMSHLTRMLFADRLAPDRLPAFTTDFSAYRFDEVLRRGDSAHRLHRARARALHRLLWLPHAAGPGRPARLGGADVRRRGRCVKTPSSPP
jgi:FMN phosphatase YigB (HAD superfamily)